jgi:hypothetical protein
MCEPSAEQQKDYVDCGGLRCPFCGSEAVECWGPFTTGENGQGWQKMECDSCEKAWEEIYQLSGIRFL